MSFIVYKVEKNLDSFYWNGSDWVKDVQHRKVFNSKKDALDLAKKLNAAIFPEDEIKRTTDDSFHAKRNIVPYSTLKEYNSRAKRRYKLLRTDCTFIGANTEIRFKAFCAD